MHSHRLPWKSADNRVDVLTLSVRPCAGIDRHRLSGGKLIGRRRSIRDPRADPSARSGDSRLSAETRIRRALRRLLDPQLWTALPDARPARASRPDPWDRGTAEWPAEPQGLPNHSQRAADVRRLAAPAPERCGAPLARRAISQASLPH